MTFINQKPVLNKEEQNISFSFANEPYNKLYHNALEGQIFKGVKTKRKEQSMAPLNFNKDKVESYNQLAINKYKIDSPIAGSVSGSGKLPDTSFSFPELTGTPETGVEPLSGAGATTAGTEEELEIPPLTFKERVERRKEQIANFPSAVGDISKTVLEDIKVPGAFIAENFAGAIDIPLQQFAKASAGATTFVGGVYYAADEFVNSIAAPAFQDIAALGSRPFREGGEEEELFEDVKPFDFIAAGEKTEDLLENAEWFFGTKLEWGDYLDVRSSNEKRTELFSTMTAEKQEALKPLENWTLAFDVVAGLASGLGAAKGPLAIANRVGQSTRLGKTMLTLDSALSGITRQLPKLGATYGAAALAYYQQTGKWLFEGNQAATEGTAMFLTSAGLSGFGRIGKAGWEMSKDGKKYISDLLSDKEFQSGVQRYFDSAKDIFADEVDKLATKVGAKTNLLPDEKILEEVTEARTIKTATQIADEADESVASLNKSISGGRQKALEKSTGFKTKLVKAGFMSEDEDFLTGLRRAFKAKTYGQFVKVEDELFGERAGDFGIGLKLKPADRAIGVQLEQTRTTGKLGQLQLTFNSVLSKGKDLDGLNNYLFAKSRFFKTRGTELPTKILGSDGKPMNVSIDELEKIYKAGEAKFGKVADELYSEYDTLLKRELEAGIRTPEDLANFKNTNPFYIGDKELDINKVLNSNPNDLNINIPKKELAKTAENVISTDSMNNAFNEMTYRYEILNKVEKLKKAKLLSEQSDLPDLITEVAKGEKTLPGNIKFNLYQDGKLVEHQGPKFFVESVFKDERSTLPSLLRPLQYLTRIKKELLTGRASIVSGFPLIAPVFEVPSAMVRVLNEGGSMKEFTQSVISNVSGGKIGLGLTSNPATGKAVEDLATYLGATFTQNKQLKKELLGTFGDEFKQYSALKSSFQKGKEAGTKVLDFIDVGNVIERKTTRLPLFTQDLAKQGLTRDALDKAVRESKGNPSELNKLLKKQGVNPELSAGVATNFFDYLAVTKMTNQFGQVIPYFNTIFTGVKGTKRLVESNPRKFIAMFGGAGALISDAIYKFNTNTPEKKARYDQSPDYRQNVPMLYFGVDEQGNDVYMKVARGLQPLEWAYPIYQQTRKAAEGEGFDFKEGFGKMFQDTTGLGLDALEFDKFLPSGVKESIEFKTGFNFFTKRSTKLSPRQQAFPTEDFNKSTSNVALGLSRYLAIGTGGKIGDDDVIRGGYQLSPRKIDSIFASFDDGTIRGVAGRFVTNAQQEGKIDTKGLFNLASYFKKTNKAATVSPDIFESKNQSSAESDIANNKITNEFEGASPEDLGQVTKDLLKLYPFKKDLIKRKLKDKIKIDNAEASVSGTEADPFKAGNLVVISKMNNNAIAYNYLRISADKSPKEADKLLADLVKAGLVNKTRLKNILKSLKIIQASEEVKVSP